MKQTLTPKQEEIRNKVAEQFSIDPERILFLNENNPEEPWLNAEALTTIARQSGQFQAIDEGFNQYIGGLNQIVHSATVVDKEGRSYTRSGVATIGERAEIDDHGLAAGRAMGAALTAAGFNPLRPGAVATLELKLEPGASLKSDEAQSRNQDLKRIHKVAEVKGLITLTRSGWDRTKYRALLVEKYGVNSAAGFDQNQRASLIQLLEKLPDEAVDEFAEVAA